MPLRVIAWLIVILNASPGVEADGNRRDEVVQYVANLTQYQKAHHYGTFVCWLLQTSADPEPELFSRSLAQQLYISEELVLIQADIRFSYSSAYATPNMVTVMANRLEDKVNASVVHSWLSGIPSDCLVVLVFKLTEEGIAESVANGWSAHNLLNVVMIALNEDVMLSFKYLPLRMIRHKGYPPFDDLLYDRITTLAEAEMKGVYVMDAFTMQGDDMVGEDARLFQLFYERLGIPFSSQMLSCQLLETYKGCISRHNGSFVVLNRLTFLEYSKDAVDTIEMEKYVILVPRGRLLSFAEIWLKPFDWSVWFVLAIICCASYLMHCIAPNTIRNNLFLLALIGLEKRKLRLSGRLEKFMAAGLLVLFYQMKCAYETKIITYMIHTPSEADPRTIDDLRRRNVVIVVDEKYLNVSVIEAKYDILLEEVGENYDELCKFKNKACVLNNVLMDVVNIDTLNADPLTGKPRFVSLKNSILTDMSFFSFYGSPLLKGRFSRFQRTIFEAGLRQHWRSSAMRYLRKSRLISFPKTSKALQTNTVQSDKFWLIFMFMAIMWSIAGLVFLFEKCFVQIRKRYVSW